MLTKRLKINDANMKSKTPKNNTYQLNVLRKPTFRNKLKNVVSFKHVKLIAAGFKNKNTKLERLVQ